MNVEFECNIQKSKIYVCFDNVGEGDHHYIFRKKKNSKDFGVIEVYLEDNDYYIEPDYTDTHPDYYSYVRDILEILSWGYELYEFKNMKDVKQFFKKHIMLKELVN